VTLEAGIENVGRGSVGIPSNLDGLPDLSLGEEFIDLPENLLGLRALGEQVEEFPDDDDDSEGQACRERPAHEPRRIPVR
jgi:hypothetical protein